MRRIVFTIAATPPIVVRVVPTRHDETSGRGIDLNVPPQRFQVAVTENSP